MVVRATEIEGLMVIRMRQVEDERGTVREFYRESSWLSAGLPSLGPWLQVNLTETRRGAVRGLHAESMHKLVAIASGQAFGAYLDLRAGSPTRGNVEQLRLAPGTQVLVPQGVANGFQSLSAGGSQYLYCFDHEWVAGMAGVAISPLTAGIQWPLAIDADDRSQVSAKDQAAPPLTELPPN
ncbi:dTDP-4-dehydrorhamnose 3,5-epimerase family protein [Nocardioides mesophilus]|uniref:dTDP-4-dehydrorhamnose 3,5-epimerase family protein n=2 Tax=Nocardioides mesophilus TaxID=433659 RepID=A0A7G9RHA4_9ACTN|nr:dTDP-4-dehydrorhamnose 3,5-epimerase family protein [Nocardioides mesophilus]